MLFLFPHPQQYCWFVQYWYSSFSIAWMTIAILIWNTNYRHHIEMLITLLWLQIFFGSDWLLHCYRSLCQVLTWWLSNWLTFIMGIPKNFIELSQGTFLCSLKIAIFNLNGAHILGQIRPKKFNISESTVLGIIFEILLKRSFLCIYQNILYTWGGLWEYVPRNIKMSFLWHYK